MKHQFCTWLQHELVGQKPYTLCLEKRESVLIYKEIECPFVHTWEPKTTKCLYHLCKNYSCSAYIDLKGQMHFH